MNADPRQNRAKRLESRMRQCNLGQKALADLAGTTKQNIYKLMRGTTRLSPEWAELLAPHLKVTPQWLLMMEDSRAASADLPEVTRIDTPEGYVAVPFISVRAGMGGGGFVEGDCLGGPKYFEESFVRNELRAKPSDLRVIEVEGQSMEPVLQNGDVVLIDRRRNNVIEPGIFVLFDGDGIVCKWVERVHGSDPAMFRIKSENERFSTYAVLAEDVQILGRVVWFARRL
ncbi:XRE family transcriptional regulator [Oecophyllibacter saccharovorans]|nr:LexA family transcriptional regulator [Oecophyllibacter saccharovorans]